MEKLLEEARGKAEEAEVFGVRQHTTHAIFEANRLKHLQTRESHSTALRVLKGGRIGLAASSGPGEDERLVQMALGAAPFGPEARFHLPGPSTPSPVEVFDPRVEEIALEALVELGQSLIDRLRRPYPELQCEARVARGVSTVEILNSRGGYARYQRSHFGLSLEGLWVRDTDMLFVGDDESSGQPPEDGGQRIVETVLEQLERAKSLAPAPRGPCPVLFTPHGLAGTLLMPLVMALNGRIVLQGASPLGERRGEKVFEACLTLRDDATMPFRPGSRPYDDEGIPTRRHALIRDGVVASFLYDLQTAGLAGVESTGSATRPDGRLPTPAPSVLVFEPGQTSLKDLLSEIKEGLVVEQLIGANQGNVLGGEFSGNVLLGYRVAKGEIIGRVKDTMVSGNIYQVLRQEIALSQERRWVGGMVLAPYLLCPQVAVAAKE